MKIPEIIQKTERPALYEKGTAFMWTDAHISKQLLDIHLNPDIDLASRKRSTIESTADWILETQRGKGVLNILDLGCGPGLYAEVFAENGHQVTGVDISPTSIEYAEKSANEKSLDISYLNENYLELDLESDTYDLVVMIYTDLGVLLPDDRDTLLKMINRVLKKGGTFIFDVLKDNDLEKKVTPKTWEVARSGFWKDDPYVALAESFFYQKEKIILSQHTIIDDDDHVEIYRFWTHFFSEEDVRKMLDPHQFVDVQLRDDILPEGTLWGGGNVLFALANI